MSNLRTAATRGKTASMQISPAVEKTLRQIGDPRMAASLAVLYAELARAQSSGDAECVEFANRSIRELLQGLPDGPIDLPLLPTLRKLQRKRRR
jgi:hypothetical protein